MKRFIAITSIVSSLLIIGGCGSDESSDAPVTTTSTAPQARTISKEPLAETRKKAVKAEERKKRQTKAKENASAAKTQRAMTKLSAWLRNHPKESRSASELAPVLSKVGDIPLTAVQEPTEPAKGKGNVVVVEGVITVTVKTDGELLRNVSSSKGQVAYNVGIVARNDDKVQNPRDFPVKVTEEERRVAEFEKNKGVDQAKKKAADKREADKQKREADAKRKREAAKKKAAEKGSSSEADTTKTTKSNASSPAATTGGASVDTKPSVKR